VALGRPDYQLALQQHEEYCQALLRCGLSLDRLPADERYPDATFVEDTAIVTECGGIITCPGALSRRGEEFAISAVLTGVYSEIHTISEPATVDGGDICEAGNHFFIGISERTNEAGATELASVLRSLGYTSSFVDIRGVPGILHLKSGIASLDGGELLLINDLFDHQEFKKFPRFRVPAGEEYAANCIHVNEFVLVAAGFPETEKLIQTMGYETVPLEMSEFQKMDGGLSCLSLRF
jgi:dimethylargininase